MAIQRALLSVYDKTGIADFARELAARGTELISTGGTAKALRDAGLKVRDVSELTGWPEMLGGRVKTLHPKVHGGILFRRGLEEDRKTVAEHSIAPIDLVAVNLYPFEEVAGKPGVKPDELIENIDIGGPAMLRSAAKNFLDVIVICDPADYSLVLKETAQNQPLSNTTRVYLAQKVFATTSRYDASIATNLERCTQLVDDIVLSQPIVDASRILPKRLFVSLHMHAPLRYGENPHQHSAVYILEGRAVIGLAGARQLQGKELSYNNLVDLDAAWKLIGEFEQPAAVIIKHNNPCGTGEQKTLVEAYRAALACDPVSAFGGVLAFNRTLDAATAEEVSKLFVECIVAPGYEEAALAKLVSKKNLRLMQINPEETKRDRYDVELKGISGGYLVQTPDIRSLTESDLKVVTKRAPSAEEKRAMLFGWKVAKHVKSNAIVFAREGQTLGVGAGQMSRVDSVKIAVMKAAVAGLQLQGSVVASDAFFPFLDGVEEAAKAGATAVIQPGGSVRDADVIATADRLNLAMIFCGVRHFRH